MTVVLMSVPLLELKSPITGPYILKAVLAKHSIACSVYDFNAYLWDAVGDIAPELWDTNGTVFGYESEMMEYESVIMPVVRKYVNEIMENDKPEWIGATQFAWTSGWITKWIFTEFRNQGFTGKTVLGGPNCMEYHEGHHMWGFADHVIYGEAEESLPALIRGELDFPGIDNKSFRQIQNLDAYPNPDYSDVDFSIYPKKFNDLHAPDAHHNPGDGLKQLFITSSRGCVRNCTFCDIQAMAPRYKFRSGRLVAEEVVEHYNKYGITHYNFTDSLINGAVKVLDEFTTHIIDFKEKGILPENLEFWGQAIARPANQTPEDHYERMYKAGIKNLSIGIESGSEAVRHHMKKKFNNADLDHTIEMAHKYGIRISCLMIVGYPTETEKDFQDTLDLFTRHQDKIGGALKSVAIGPTMVVLPKAPISQMLGEMSMYSDINGDWVYNENTLEVRLERWLRLREHVISLGYQAYPDRHSLQIKQYKDKLAEIRLNRAAPSEISYVEKYGYENVFKENHKPN